MASLTSSRSGLFAVEFRRTDSDRKPPSRVLTPMLMGDPTPDREAIAEAKRLAFGSIPRNRKDACQ